MMTTLSVARIRKGEIPKVRMLLIIIGEIFFLLIKVIFMGTLFPLRKQNAKAQEANWAITVAAAAPAAFI